MRATPKLAAALGLALAALVAGVTVAHAQKPGGGPQPPNQPPPAFGAAPSAFTMGEIGRRATYGKDGDWLTTATGDGALVYANTGTAAGWTANIIQPPRPSYTVQVEVNSGIASQDGHAVGAGITFAFQPSGDPSKRLFYAVLVAGDTVYAYRYDGTFDELVRNTSTDLAGGRKWTTLQVTVRPDGFSLALNGEEVTSMNADGLSAGRVGVMVSGAGNAAFRNFRLQ